MIDLFEQPSDETERAPDESSLETERVPDESSATKSKAESKAESKPKRQRETGTILWWKNGVGQIKSDSGETVAVHQVDLQFHGSGKRELPVNHQVEYIRCYGPMGEVRACELSRSVGRLWVFNEDDEEASKTGEKEKNDDASSVDPKEHRLLEYFCISEIDETVFTGTILHFNAEYLYATIKQDEEQSKAEIFCDASNIKKNGSYMSVRRGVKVEFRKGTNAAGTVVATCCTGPDGKAIDNKTLRKFLPQKRKLVNGVCDAKKRNKPNPFPTQPDIVLPPAPRIPKGKSPVCVICEFAVCCKPKKLVSFKLIGEEFRTHCTNGVRNAYTYECRLDGEFIAKGTAKTKKVAKTYAAQFAVEAMRKLSDEYEAEIERIRKGIKVVKKRPPPAVRPAVTRNTTRWIPAKKNNTSSYKRFKPNMHVNVTPVYTGAGNEQYMRYNYQLGTVQKNSHYSAYGSTSQATQYPYSVVTDQANSLTKSVNQYQTQPSVSQPAVPDPATYRSIPVNYGSNPTYQTSAHNIIGSAQPAIHSQSGIQSHQPVQPKTQGDQAQPPLRAQPPLQPDHHQLEKYLSLQTHQSPQMQPTVEDQRQVHVNRLQQPSQMEGVFHETPSTSQLPSNSVQASQPQNKQTIETQLYTQSLQPTQHQQVYSTHPTHQLHNQQQPASYNQYTQHYQTPAESPARAVVPTGYDHNLGFVEKSSTEIAQQPQQPEVQKPITYSQLVYQQPIPSQQKDAESISSETNNLTQHSQYHMLQEPGTYSSHGYHQPVQQQQKEANNISLESTYMQVQAEARRTLYPYF